MRFLISTPVWGKRCLDVFTGPVLDSHADALRGFKHDVRYLCHTDDAPRVREAVSSKTGREVVCVPRLNPSAVDHTCLASCHADAMAKAEPGDAVLFLNADILISVETFRAVARLLTEGTKAILCAGIRTDPKAPPPRHASGRTLLSWALANQHFLTSCAFYGKGKTRVPAVILFDDGEEIVLRGFHLHPLAILNERGLSFKTTVDWDLAAKFPREAVHVVTDPDELAIAEISPTERRHTVGPTPLTEAEILSWASKRTVPFHWWLFSHRIRLQGFGGTFCDEAVEQRLRAASGGLHVEA